MVYLALDPGLAHIGIAISYEGKLAVPLTTIPAHNLVSQVRPLLETYRPDVLVIGEPDPGPIRDLAIVLRDEIRRYYGGKIVLHPEDLTSQEAARKLVEAGTAKTKRQKQEHAAAASLILQDYLDLLQ